MALITAAGSTLTLAACPFEVEDPEIELRSDASSDGGRGDSAPLPPRVDAGAFDSGRGVDAATPTTLLQRLGGEPGVTKYIDALIAAEVADPEIASYFAPNALSVPPQAKPTIGQIKQCMVKQIVNAAGGAAAYPTALGGGYQCRDMQAAHANLHIGSGTYDKFVAIAVAVASNAGLSPTDVQTITGFFSVQKGTIVDPDAPDGGFYDPDGG